ncbi:sugar ABC transporter substrate-binding protein [Pengzhenrongella sp.]|uniref:ABC transporter substrate-binding protein n=1 Tax=Pengzhenrongella sp. TaxID=2888820 RepID=UPI002F92F953
MNTLRARPRRTARWLAAGVAATMLLAACSAGGGGGSPAASASAAAVSQADIDKAMKTPTNLTFWTWVPGIEKEVALFEKAYPAIKVKVVNAGQGEPQYTKLRTALSAGTGAPDVVQIEFQYIPTFTVTDSLLDLRPFGAGELKDQFVDWTWGQVTGDNGEVWAIPQDSGPMGMLYRTDILAKYKITPPTTWEEFANAARALHQGDPKAYLTNLASNQNGVWMGLLWAAGAKPFSSTGKGHVTINVNDKVSQRVADYWGPLVNDGVVSTDPDFTDSWYQGLNSGKYATWLTAAWAPVFLTSSAASTSGKWRAAPLPQEKAGGTQKSGNWGGSTSAVVKSTKNPIASAKFAEFINTDPASAKMLSTSQFLFPPTTAMLTDPAIVEEKPAFYGGQQVNQVFADISKTVDTDFQWPPFLDQAVNDWDETVGKALADKTDLKAALDEWQNRLITYAENQGFTVDKP